MKSTTVQPGEFIAPAGAQLRSAPNEAAVVKVWQEVGDCLGYPKPDGWRFQVHKIGSVVKLFSRAGKDWAEEYPSIVDMIRAQVEDEMAVLDTELVGFDQHGYHLEPSNLRNASQYRCYLLDVLYLKRKNLTPLPTKKRVDIIREHLRHAFGGMLIFAEYTSIRSQDDLISFYQVCLARRKEGFDGAIIKRLYMHYFDDVLKVKPEETIDAVVVGAYQNEQGAVRTLLLAVPDHVSKSWIPIAKAKRTGTQWDTIWEACQSLVLDLPPDNLHDLPGTPDIWINPKVVVKVTMTILQPGKGYQVRAEYARECTLREDKGPEKATSFAQVLQMAGLMQRTKIPGARPKQVQLSLFEE